MAAGDKTVEDLKIHTCQEIKVRRPPYLAVPGPPPLLGLVVVIARNRIFDMSIRFSSCGTLFHSDLAHSENRQSFTTVDIGPLV
jgi:hypothetical protein